MVTVPARFQAGSLDHCTGPCPGFEGMEKRRLAAYGITEGRDFWNANNAIVTFVLQIFMLDKVFFYYKIVLKRTKRRMQ